MLEEKLKVLYVDDEENNLTSFKAWFRKQYDVFTAKTVVEANEILKTNNIHIFIADQRMPLTTGIEFLKQTIENFPDSIRLLITGQSDIEVVIQAINQGQVSKYITKPWQWDKLQQELENCAQIYNARIDIKDKNNQLLKLNEELNKFVYSLSHDVRSPLTTILDIVNLSRQEKNIENQSEYFTMIESCVNRLDVYLKNIIDYYRSSRTEDVSVDIDFVSLIDEVIEAHKFQDLSIDYQTDIDQKSIFTSDLFRIKIILNNLVSNAVKYQNPNNEKHNITIKVVVREKAALISVTDNGIGILNENIKDIFQLFYRTNNPKNANGSGIGLFIVKEALEKIRGNINVTSTPMVRTCFEFSIPNKR